MPSTGANFDTNRILGITRLKITLRTEVSDERSFFGTGFWVQLPSTTCVLVTNRHNVDPKLRLGARTVYALAGISIQLRGVSEGKPTARVEFFELRDPQQQVLPSEDTDCALILIDFLQPTENFKKITALSSTDIADNSWLAREVFITDAAAFIGYPGEEVTRPIEHGTETYYLHPKIIGIMSGLFKIA